MKANDDEFYVGYLSSAPERTAAFVRKVVVFTGGFIGIIAILLAWYQKKFSEATFEYGINSTVEGYYFDKPVPHIAVPLGLSKGGKELYQNVIVVGFGKAGGTDVMTRIQQREGRSFIGSKIALTGFKIHGNGKALLQVTEEDNPSLDLRGKAILQAETIDSLDIHSLSGEIVDPKCYFGVMKPGEGKAHRSCAIRCIAGGMPPVFHATNVGDYFLLVNEKGEPLNNEILDIVGDQITLKGKGLIWNDWKILEVKTKDLESITANHRLIEQLKSFENGMTFCSDDVAMHTEQMSN